MSSASPSAAILVVLRTDTRPPSGRRRREHNMYQRRVVQWRRRACLPLRCIHGDMDVAVLLLAFNRPERLAVCVDRLRSVRPRRVYIAVDGPRMDPIS